MKLLKNKNGFTLVEILCVTVIVSLLTVFAVPNVTQLLNKEKESATDIQKDLIIDAAKLYISDCSITNNKNCSFIETGNESIFNINDLVDSNYLDKVIIDGNVCSGMIIKKGQDFKIELSC